MKSIGAPDVSRSGWSLTDVDSQQALDELSTLLYHDAEIDKPKSLQSPLAAPAAIEPAIAAEPSDPDAAAADHLAEPVGRLVDLPAIGCAPCGDSKPSDRLGRSPRVRSWIVAGCLALAAWCFFQGFADSSRRATGDPAAPNAGESLSPLALADPGAVVEQPRRTTPIEEIQAGDRVLGENPLREQVDDVEPDPATWRKLRLHMRKASGQSLWIDLLRPLDWIEAADVETGRTIFLSLPELGAFGDAEVVDLGPCPPIRPGRGTVVTGKFTHHTDGNSEVVQLRLEGQPEPTGVTANHPYWSEDRQDFVEAGQLRPGERVDTADGLRRVVSVTPIEHDGLLYNLETTEHVYRVGSLATLVHNNGCADDLLVRRGTSRESAQRLAKQAELAEKAGTAQNGVPFGHGVSVTTPESNLRLAKDPLDAVTARRKALEEAGFEVRYTPVRADTNHHTVQLPKPVTEQVANLFNQIFGRKPKGGG